MSGRSLIGLVIGSLILVSGGRGSSKPQGDGARNGLIAFQRLVANGTGAASGPTDEVPADSLGAARTLLPFPNAIREPSGDDSGSERTSFAIRRSPIGEEGDDRFRCGSGSDRVLADQRDRIARDCERVRRR